VFRSRKLRRAFEKEALPHLDALYGMALRLTRDPGAAEDLVQDSLVKAFRFFHRYEEGSNIKAWLFKVMVNIHYNTCRKSRKDHRIQVQAEVDSHLERYLSASTTSGRRAEDVLLSGIVVEQLRAAVEELPEEFRTAVLLCDLHDFSYKEIADIVGCPVGTVMSRLYRGRKLLQKRLFDYAVEQGYVRPATERAATTGETGERTETEKGEPAEQTGERGVESPRSEAHGAQTTDIEAYRQRRAQVGGGEAAPAPRPRGRPR
jgi:RNA polymerase sigma-70 factor, ECF subfamily